MVKYLTELQLITDLSLGKAVEQWVGYNEEEDYTILKWLRIDKEKTGKKFSVSLFEVFDEGSEDFLDIYEFSPIDPDALYGNITSFKSSEEALKFSIENLSAKMDKFLPNGLIQNEYEYYFQRRKSKN